MRKNKKMLYIQKDRTDGTEDAKTLVVRSICAVLKDVDYNYLKINCNKDFNDYVLEHTKVVVKKGASEKLIKLIRTRETQLKIKPEWIGMGISAVFTDKQMGLINKQWNIEGSYKKCPWWLYVLKHVEVKLDK